MEKRPNICTSYEVNQVTGSSNITVSNVSTDTRTDDEWWFDYRKQMGRKMDIPFKECVNCLQIERHWRDDYLCWVCRDVGQIRPERPRNPYSITSAGQNITISTCINYAE